MAKTNWKTIQKWQQKAMRTFSFRFHKEYQADIIKKLDAQENKTGYVAKLIEEDIKKNGLD